MQAVAQCRKPGDCDVSDQLGKLVGADGSAQVGLGSCGVLGVEPPHQRGPLGSTEDHVAGPRVRAGREVAAEPGRKLDRVTQGRRREVLRAGQEPLA